MTAGSGAIRTLDLPCRLGVLTLWNPRQRLRVYPLGLFDQTSEDELLRHFKSEAAELPGALLYGVRIPEDSPRIAWRDGLIRYMPQGGERYIVELDRTFEEYLAAFPGKTRSTLRRKIRRFEKAAGGALDFREYRGSDGLARFHPLARQVSARSYQEIRLGSGLPDNPEFHREMAEAGRADRARGYLLFLEDRPVAYLYAPIADATARYEFVGYDPDVAALSPGTVLLLKVLERLFEDPATRYFDFTEGGGDGSHKAFFATRQVRCGNVYLLKPTLRNCTIVAAQTGTALLSGTAGRLLAGLGLKTRIRSVLRRTAKPS